MHPFCKDMNASKQVSRDNLMSRKQMKNTDDEFLSQLVSARFRVNGLERI